MVLQLSGIHHLTAITAKAAQNMRFYTRTLGMRLVKKTVNQDDTSAYHLFYADGKASPGSDVTFFDWPAAPERRGSNSVVRTGLRVAGPESLTFWRERLMREGVSVADVTTVAGRSSLDFEDAEGQRFRLVDDGAEGSAHPWEKSPVPAEHQIRGLGPIVLSVPDRAPTARMLTEVMNMRQTGEHETPEGMLFVFSMGEGGPAAELHVLEQPGLRPAVQGAGAVHHVAFRTPDVDAIHGWAKHLEAMRVRSSGEVERYYFRSLYFREPNGILFEIATDGPGFAVDEPMESLGEKLSLPPFLEPQRAQIEAGLKPLA